MRSGRGKVETIALIWAAFSVSPSISDHDREKEKYELKQRLQILYYTAFCLAQLQFLHACSSYNSYSKE